MNVRAYAKVNLSLEVCGRRSDGFHELKSVVLPISLADEITLTEAGEFSVDTGYGDRDLALRSARRLQLAGRSESECPPVRISILKRIPAGGGLGGGSADAAATLLALNRLWRLEWTPERLAALGSEIGSDVPAQVIGMAYRCPVMMSGRGETVARRSLDALDADFLPSRELVLVNPGVFCSTAEVYANCTSRTQSSVLPVNDLQAPAVRLHPEIGEALRLLADSGAEGTRMSGSGATVFGFASDAAKANALAEQMRQRGYAAWTASPLI